jgi:DNA-directed RNA polymerase subunit delta
MKKSMIDIAYQVVSDNPGSLPFIDLWTAVSKDMGFNQVQFEDNIAQFYTDLSLDGRFLNMSGNTWDLRSRHKYSESVLDTDSIALDEDSDDEELEQDSEESLQM